MQGPRESPWGGESEYPRSAFKYQNKNLMVVCDGMLS
jgi:hypothetical protein